MYPLHPRPYLTAPLFPDTTAFRSRDVLQRVQRGLALGGGRGRSVEIQDVGAKPLRRALEAQPRTRGGFEEQRAHRGAGQRTAAFAVDEGLRAVQQRDQGVARQAFEREQVAQAAVGRSEEHTSELQSLMRISYAVFCLKKKTK